MSVFISCKYMFQCNHRNIEKAESASNESNSCQFSPQYFAVICNALEYWKAMGTTARPLLDFSSLLT